VQPQSIQIIFKKVLKKSYTYDKEAKLLSFGIFFVTMMGEAVSFPNTTHPPLICGAAKKRVLLSLQYRFRLVLQMFVNSYKTLGAVSSVSKMFVGEILRSSPMRGLGT